MLIGRLGHRYIYRHVNELNDLDLVLYYYDKTKNKNHSLLTLLYYL